MTVTNNRIEVELVTDIARGPSQHKFLPSLFSTQSREDRTCSGSNRSISTPSGPRHRELRCHQSDQAMKATLSTELDCAARQIPTWCKVAAQTHGIYDPDGYFDTLGKIKAAGLL